MSASGIFDGESNEDNYPWFVCILLIIKPPSTPHTAWNRYLIIKYSEALGISSVCTGPFKIRRNPLFCSSITPRNESIAQRSLRHPIRTNNCAHMGAVFGLRFPIRCRWRRSCIKFVAIYWNKCVCQVDINLIPSYSVSDRRLSRLPASPEICFYI